MTRKSLLSMLAAIAAALLPAAAFAQVAPSTTTAAPEEKTEPDYRYAVSVGYGYTSLNQVNQSRSGLQGVEASVTRDFSKHFGVIADGAFYKYSIKSGNPGTPAVDVVLFGPVVHAELYGKVSGYVRGLLGGEHTAGEFENPNISFAGGFGVGLEYALTPRISLRAGGDDILSSFVQDPQHLGYSTHRRANGRAALSVVYHF